MTGNVAAGAAAGAGGSGDSRAGPAAAAGAGGSGDPRAGSAAAAGAGGSGDARAPLAGDWVRIDVPGGYLNWSKKKGELNAHCTTHGDGRTCKCDRVSGPGHDAGNRGRPLGRQLLWLSWGAGLTHKEHLDSKTQVGKESLHDDRLEKRREFVAPRDFVEACERGEVERPPKDGEDEEPLISR